MDHERAETYLRLQAEAELSRAAGRSSGTPDPAERISRIAHVLAAVGALDEDLADEILKEFQLALDTRRGGPVPRSATFLPRQAGTPGPPPAPGRVVPAGRLIPVRDQGITGEIYLLSYARVARRGLLTMIARPDPARPAEMFHFMPFAATDDRGTSYEMGLHGSGGPGPGGWILRLHPDPPPDLRWLDLTTTPGEPATRVSMSPPGTPGTVISATATSPGEHLLDIIAMQMLATSPAFPREIPLHVAGLRLTPVVDGIGDVIAALHACGALDPLSPLPGQLAALCQQLNVGGHGITAPPAGDLPDPWRSVLTQFFIYRKSEPDPSQDDCAVAATVLPELSGVTLAILGLHQPGNRTTLFAHVSGRTLNRWLEPTAWPAIWIRDPDGRWHATRARDWSADLDNEITMEMDVIPPLSRTTDSIDLIAAAPSAEARVTLPLRWA